jgi:hypothetical protein
MSQQEKYIVELSTLQFFFLAFADDAVLLSPSSIGLQESLNCFATFCA